MRKATFGEENALPPSEGCCKEDSRLLQHKQQRGLGLRNHQNLSGAINQFGRIHQYDPINFHCMICGWNEMFLLTKKIRCRFRNFWNGKKWIALAPSNPTLRTWKAWGVWFDEWWQTQENRVISTNISRTGRHVTETRTHQVIKHVLVTRVWGLESRAWKTAQILSTVNFDKHFSFFPLFFLESSPCLGHLMSSIQELTSHNFLLRRSTRLSHADPKEFERAWFVAWGSNSTQPEIPPRRTSLEIARIMRFVVSATFFFLLGGNLILSHPHAPP